MKRFYITTPIYYVNAKPHLGHAYSTVTVDAAARYHRLAGEETYFLTGTDEHGDKIVKAAEAYNQSPQEYADAISGLFQDLWPHLGIANNDFIRTTQERHIKTVQAVLQKVYDKGDIYYGEYGGHYCFGCERFYTEKELTEDGTCPDHGTTPEYIAEKNYFFKMSKYQAALREHIEKKPDFIRPERYRNEVVALLDGGALEDLCISRPKSRLTWGIELPFDANYVTYVWFDALLNYLTALDWPDGEKFRHFWPAAQHVVAKDILKPHAVFWPTMLMSAELPLYDHLNVHGYWLIKDTKMSKSLGNIVEPLDMVERFGLDPFRYFLLREMRFGNDASFSEEALAGRLNSDLANDLGNLFSRVLSMTHKYFQGVVPADGDHAEADKEIIALGREAMRNYQRLFERMRISSALESLWELVRALNKYVDDMQPWGLSKQGETERLGVVMYVLLEHMRKIALHLWPVMPGSAEAMLEQLGVAFDMEKVELEAEIESWGGLPSGVQAAKASNLFPRVEIEKNEESKPAEKKKKDKKKGEKKADKAEPAGDGTIEFGDFQKVDLRIGTVLKADDHPDADRLYVLTIDAGEPEPRTVVSGLREHFTADQLVGRQIVLAANLAPRKLRGVMSRGMVLAVKKDDGLELLTVTGDVANGGKVS